MNFRSGYALQGEALGCQPVSVNLTANNQIVNMMGVKPADVIFLASDSISPSTRTFTLQSSNILGHKLTLIFTSGASAGFYTTATLASGSNVALTNNWVPILNDTLTLTWDGSQWVEIARNNGYQLSFTVSYVWTRVRTLNTSPMTIVPAQGTGKTAVVDEIQLFNKFQTAPFSGGGAALTFQYLGASTIAQMSPSFINASQSVASVIEPPYPATAADTGFSLTANTNRGVILRSSSAFTGGVNGSLLTAVTKYKIITNLT